MMRRFSLHRTLELRLCFLGAKRKTIREKHWDDKSCLKIWRTIASTGAAIIALGTRSRPARPSIKYLKRLNYELTDRPRQKRRCITKTDGELYVLIPSRLKRFIFSLPLSLSPSSRLDSRVISKINFLGIFWNLHPTHNKQAVDDDSRSLHLALLLPPRPRYYILKQ